MGKNLKVLTHLHPLLLKKKKYYFGVRPVDAMTCGEVRTQLPRVGLSPPWVPRIASRHIIYKYFYPLSSLSGLIMPLADLYSVLGEEGENGWFKVQISLLGYKCSGCF